MMMMMMMMMMMKMMKMIISLKTCWIQSILLFTVLQCWATQGPPRALFHLQCSRPCDETDCSVDVHCVWDERTLREIPTNYTLYWKSAHESVFNALRCPKSNGLILRKDFKTHEKLTVWVQAGSQQGFSQSQELNFYPENIIKPPPPTFSSSYIDPLEIHWSSACNQLQLFIGTCDLRYRTEGDRDWQKEDELGVTYTFIDPIPGAVYEFQVRCCCKAGLFSDWNAVHHIKSEESAPVGVVDVWRDCGITPTSADCYLTWKNLPASQAHGLILVHQIMLSYKNGSIAQMNASTASPSSHFVSEEGKWCLRSPLKDVSSLSVTAFNTCGATVPAFLSMPLTGKERNDGALKLEINEENLTVYWDLPSQLDDRVNRFIVQYKEAGLPAGQGFDWRTVSRSQTVRFTGLFKKYTPYQVALFQILNTGGVQHISSVFGYSLQKAPTTVPSLNVVSIEQDEVTLQWKPVPLMEQNGLILYYQVGIGSQEVHNVSVSSQHNNYKKSLKLQPAQEYEAWVRAVNAAGPGPSVTARFTTQHHRDLAHIFGILAGVLLFIFFTFSAFLFCVCRGKSKLCQLASETCRVPDPRHSNILKGIKHQINDPLAWMCIPVPESIPNISQLEILETKPEDFDPDRCTDAGTRTGCLQMNFADDETVNVFRDRKNCRYDGKDYSKMVDSDEDRKSCWSSSEEELRPSDYEKHFMPTAADLLEV